MKLRFASARTLRSSEDGQALVETVAWTMLAMLAVMMIADLAFLILASAWTTSGARLAAEYSIQGPQSATGASFPSASTVLNTGLNETNNLTPSSSTLITGCWAPGQGGFCQNEGANSDQNTCSSGGCMTSQEDPESSSFFLNAVQLSYPATPPFTFTIFGHPLIPTKMLVRTVYMRQLCDSSSNCEQ